jgi:hypothetical protein
MARLFANNTIGALYKDQLNKEHSGSKWGSTGARYSGSALAAVLESRPYVETALDYGCGKGTISQTFLDLEWDEYDPGIPEKSEKPDGQYDLVTCTDVMEHVEEAFVDDVIKELGAYTKKVLFVDIACYLTGKTFAEGPYKGEDLHITILDPNVWIERFNALTGLTLLESKVIDKMSKGKMKTRVQLTYERV